MVYLEVTALTKAPVELWLSPVPDSLGCLALMLSESSALILPEQHWPQVPFCIPSRWKLDPSLKYR